jgi:hypothetical protein
MASFNGASLGFIFEMNPNPNPKARQINTYPGATGLEVLDQGGRGGTTTVLGAVLGGSPSGLDSAISTFRSLQQDGGQYTLLDNLGRSWSGVILVAFNTVGQARPLVGGGYAKRYEAEFLHVF